MKIFLDDVRHPEICVNYMYQRIGKLNPIYLEEWVIVKNYGQFVKAITENIDSITHISFDHDLAEEHYVCDRWEDSMYDIYEEKTGYDCAKWVKEFYAINETDLPVMFIHSMNPIGTQNIVNLFK